jgi:hypothetical protein
MVGLDAQHEVAAKDEGNACRGGQRGQADHATAAPCARSPGRRGAVGLALADERAPLVPVCRLGVAQHLGCAGDFRPITLVVGARRQPGLEAVAQFIVRRLLAERDQPVAGGGWSVAVRRNRCLAHASESSLTSYTTAIGVIFRSFS